MATSYTDHDTLLQFLKALANARVYNSRDTGYVITEYWKQEAECWLNRIEQEAKAEALAVLSQNEPKVL